MPVSTRSRKLQVHEEEPAKKRTRRARVVKTPSEHRSKEKTPSKKLHSNKPSETNKPSEKPPSVKEKTPSPKAITPSEKPPSVKEKTPSPKTKTPSEQDLSLLLDSVFTKDIKYNYFYANNKVLTRYLSFVEKNKIGSQYELPHSFVPVSLGFEFEFNSMIPCVIKNQNTIEMLYIPLDKIRNPFGDTPHIIHKSINVGNSSGIFTFHTDISDGSYLNGPFTSLDEKHVINANWDTINKLKTDIKNEKCRKPCGAKLNIEIHALYINLSTFKNNHILRAYVDALKGIFNIFDSFTPVACNIKTKDVKANMCLLKPTPESGMGTLETSDGKTINNVLYLSSHLSITPQMTIGIHVDTIVNYFQKRINFPFFQKFPPYYVYTSLPGYIKEYGKEQAYNFLIICFILMNIEKDNSTKKNIYTKGCTCFRHKISEFPINDTLIGYLKEIFDFNFISHHINSSDITDYFYNKTGKLHEYENNLSIPQPYDNTKGIVLIEIRCNEAISIMRQIFIDAPHVGLNIV